MPLTLTYKIDRLKVKDEVNNDGVTLENAVCQTYWTCTGTDSANNSGTFSGATPLSAAAVSEGDFTAFSDLQESEVIGWIQAIVDGDADYKAHIEAIIQKDIDVDLEEEIDSGALPWADNAAPEGANTAPV